MTTNFSQSSPDRENQINQTSLPSNQGHYSGKLLAKNTIYNIMGRALPMIVAFFTIPQVIKGLGVESFGVLSLVWVVIGYFGIFDLGIGRATVKYVAEAVFHKKFDQLSSLFWTSLLFLVGFGLIGGALLSLFVPLLVNHIFNIPEGLKYQSEISFFILAATMPFIIGSSGVRGTLEGQHRFDLINMIKIPASIITFVSPLIVLLFTNNLIYIVAVLAGNRVLSFGIYFIFCVRLLPYGKKPKLSEKTMIKKLFRFGGWMTVTNIVGSLMALGYVDKFFISSLLTMSAVSYYSTPFELITKFLFISGAILGVVFPLFSAYSIRQKRELFILHQRTIKIVLLYAIPITVIIIAFAHPFLKLWLGEEFAIKSTLVLQLISIGVLIGAVSTVPFVALQALGRPDLTAKRHLVELPFYIGASWFCTSHWGIVGASAVWTIWIVVDTAVLFWLFIKTLDMNIRLSILRISSGIISLTTAIIIAFLIANISNLILSIMAILIEVTGIFILNWRFILNFQDRIKLRELLTSSFKIST